MMTGMNAPTTHASWNRVSNFANDRPRFASGASRWTIESNASLPPLAPRPTTSAAAVAENKRLPDVAAAMPVTITSKSTAMRMFSSRHACRSRGVSTAPSSAPNPLAASTTANQNSEDPALRM